MVGTVGVNPSPDELRGWTPIRVAGSGAEQVIDWCFTAGVDFVDPFFDQTVAECFRDPFRLLFRHQTSLATLAAVAAASASVRPSGFILHSSRCGSTLVTQMLAALGGPAPPATLVLSEPAPLDTMLRAGHVDRVRWMVAALGRGRAEGKPYVVKLDAWAVLSLATITRAFPDVPLVFLYRDPVEVMVSHMGHRGYHMVPGCLPPDLLGLTVADVATMDPDEYLARVLGRLLEAVANADLAPGTAPLLVEYRDLPAAVPDRIAPHFGIEVSAAARSLMLETAWRDAKNPFLPFVADTTEKQRRASDQLRAYSDRWCRRHYDLLESCRSAMAAADRP
jgi:hypothetical protein